MYYYCDLFLSIDFKCKSSQFLLHAPPERAEKCISRQRGFHHPSTKMQEERRFLQAGQIIQIKTAIILSKQQGAKGGHVEENSRQHQLCSDGGVTCQDIQC